MKVRLDPDRVVRITPTDPPNVAAYFPTFHARTSPNGSALLLSPSIPYGWSEYWHAYKGAEAHDDVTGDVLYSRYDFEDDGTVVCWYCVPCRVLWRGTWAYEE